MRIRSVLTHGAQAIAECALIALLVVGLLAGSVLAAPGGKPSSGSLALEMVTDANTNGLPNYMDGVTFDVSSSGTRQLTVGVRCWQGANFVYDAYVGYFEGAWFATYFTLGSMYWNPALNATCTARLFYYSNRGTERILGTSNFGVAP
jgi:hypothetical protein